jgi:cytochrome c
LGIGCETCHGPARRHVEAARAKEKELHLPRLGESPEQVSDRICGTCHGPSEEPNLENPRVRAQLSRFQALALSMSACVTKGSRPLTCMSCHDPHKDAARGDFAAYNRVCASCHGVGGGSPPCPREPRGNCVSCHMPARGIGLRGGPQYRTHWIGIW